MGSWGEGAFDNDAATDWSFKLEASPDLSVVEQALAAVNDNGEGIILEETGSVAVAAAEVVARLRGKPGLENAYTAAVDQ